MIHHRNGHVNGGSRGGFGYSSGVHNPFRGGSSRLTYADPRYRGGSPSSPRGGGSFMKCNNPHGNVWKCAVLLVTIAFVTYSSFWAPAAAPTPTTTIPPQVAPTVSSTSQSLLTPSKPSRISPSSDLKKNPTTNRDSGDVESSKTTSRRDGNEMMETPEEGSESHDGGVGNEERENDESADPGRLVVNENEGGTIDDEDERASKEFMFNGSVEEEDDRDKEDDEALDKGNSNEDDTIKNSEDRLDSRPDHYENGDVNDHSGTTAITDGPSANEVKETGESGELSVDNTVELPKIIPLQRDTVAANKLLMQTPEAETGTEPLDESLTTESINTTLTSHDEASADLNNETVTTVEAVIETPSVETALKTAADSMAEVSGGEESSALVESEDTSPRTGTIDEASADLGTNNIVEGDGQPVTSVDNASNENADHILIHDAETTTVEVSNAASEPVAENSDSRVVEAEASTQFTPPNEVLLQDAAPPGLVTADSEESTKSDVVLLPTTVEAAASNVSEASASNASNVQPSVLEGTDEESVINTDSEADESATNNSSTTRDASLETEADELSTAVHDMETDLGAGGDETDESAQHKVDNELLLDGEDGGQNIKTDSDEEEIEKGRGKDAVTDSENDGAGPPDSKKSEVNDSTPNEVAPPTEVELPDSSAKSAQEAGSQGKSSDAKRDESSDVNIDEEKAEPVEKQDAELTDKDEETTKPEVSDLIDTESKDVTTPLPSKKEENRSKEEAAVQQELVEETVYASKGGLESAPKGKSNKASTNAADMGTESAEEVQDHVEPTSTMDESSKRKVSDHKVSEPHENTPDVVTSSKENREKEKAEHVNTDPTIGDKGKSVRGKKVKGQTKEDAEHVKEDDPSKDDPESAEKGMRTKAFKKDVKSAKGVKDRDKETKNVHSDSKLDLSDRKASDPQENVPETLLLRSNKKEKRKKEGLGHNELTDSEGESEPAETEKSNNDNDADSAKKNRKRKLPLPDSKKHEKGKATAEASGKDATEKVVALRGSTKGIEKTES